MVCFSLRVIMLLQALIKIACLSNIVFIMMRTVYDVNESHEAKFLNSLGIIIKNESNGDVTELK